jgi:hypothetical protein
MKKVLVCFFLLLAFCRFVSAQGNCDTTYIPRAIMLPVERLQLCNNDTITLVGMNDSEDYQLRWFRNDAEIAGETSPALVVTTPGVYSFRLFKNGCYSQNYDSKTIVLKDQKRPAIRTLSIVQQPANAGESFTLNYTNIGNASLVTRKWLRSELIVPNSGSTYTGNGPGAYFVRTDSNGCYSNSNVVLVQPSGAIKPIVCELSYIQPFVTLKWSTTNPAVQTVRFYRKRSNESNFIQFDGIEASTGVFEDTGFYNASFEYRMTATVTAASGTYESEPSEFNKSIFVKVTSSPPGFTPRKILNWNPYSGFTVEKYLIYRNNILLDSTAGTENLYEDFAPLTQAIYRVEGINSESCIPFGRINVGNSTQANIRKSISNNSSVTLGVNPSDVDASISFFASGSRVYAGFSYSVATGSQPIILNGSPAGGRWSGSPEVSSSGVFTPGTCGSKKLVYAVDGLGKDSIYITVLPTGVTTNPVTITGPFLLCGTAGGNVTYTGSPLAGTWGVPLAGNGSFNPVPWVGKMVRVSYKKTVNGCAYAAERTVNVFPSSIPLEVTGSTNPCQNQSVQLSYNYPFGGDLNVSWFRNAVLIPNQFSSSYSPTQSGTYKVTITEINFNCATTTTSQTLAFSPVTPPSAPVITRNGNVLQSDFVSNQWYRNLVLMPGETGQTLVMPGSGFYNATRTSGSCISAASNAINYDVLNVNGTETALKFTAFPNPVSDFLNWEGTVVVEEVCIINMLGQKIMTSSAKGLESRISVRDLKAGYYVLRLRGDKGLERCFTFYKQ